MPTLSAPVCLVRGSINIDIFYPLPHIVRPGQTLATNASPTTRIGGKGANVALACALAGSQVLLDACVGADSEGEGVIKELTRKLDGPGEREGSKQSGRISGDRIARWDKGQTGKALIQIGDDGENAIILIPGANFAPPPNPAYDPLFPPQVTHLVLANEIPLESTISYLERSGRTVTTLFNPSPMLKRQEILQFPWSAVDWLVVNEGELRDVTVALCNLDYVPEDGVDDPHRVLDKIDQLGDVVSSSKAKALMDLLATTLNDRDSKFGMEPRPGRTNIICTLGSSGILYTLPMNPPVSTPESGVRIAHQGVPGRCRRGESGYKETEEEVPFKREIAHLPSAQLRNPLKDTTGAGDCFLGYFVAGLMRLRAEGSKVVDAELRQIIERCLAACAICVEREGAQDSYASIGEVEERLSRS